MVLDVKELNKTFNYKNLGSLILFSLKLTRKSSTWQVMLQSRKSRELTVNPYSCGSYDLI